MKLLKNRMRMEEISSGLGNALEAEENTEKIKRMKKRQRLKNILMG
jgi:hypothetical protein